MPLTHGPDAKPHWRYLLHVHIHPTDAAILKDALDGEPFGMKTRLGAAEIHRQIDQHELSVDAQSLERWDDFDHDIEILSVYLSEYIEGTEIQVEPTKGAPVLHAWKIVGRRGEVVRLEREVHWEDESIVLGDEHLEPLKKRWATFPEWVRDAMRQKYPGLRQL